MTTPETIPTDWQEQVSNALEKMRATDPTKAVFGVTLPEGWKPELEYYVRNGEMRRMFGVRAVSFGGKTISSFDAPGEKKEAKIHKKAG